MRVEFLDLSGQDPVVTKSADYFYDYANRWIKQSIDADGDGYAAAVDTLFAYDGNQMLWELDSTGSVEHSYLWANAVDQLLADESASGVLWGLGDHLGTIRDLAAYNAGTGETSIVNHRQYSAFGELLSETSSAPEDTSRIGYTGRPFDSFSGLQNNLHRWYDPTTGRWIATDPIGFEAGDGNLYRYVGNHATGAVDPSGLVQFNSPNMTENRGWDNRADAFNVSLPPRSRAGGTHLTGGQRRYLSDVGVGMNDGFNQDLKRQAYRQGQKSVAAEQDKDAFYREVDRQFKEDMSFAFGGDIAEANPSGFGHFISMWFGLTGLDVYKDVGDLSHGFYNWEWSWGHASNQALNFVALSPAIGMVKNVGKAGPAIKNSICDELDELATIFKSDTLRSAPKSASERLPQLKGRSEHEIGSMLEDAGYTRTKVSNSAARNETWTHPDGSEVRIHPYGNANQAPYRSANNAHVHRQDPLGNQLNDRGLPSTIPADTHIGIPNPPDLPIVRGRPHGAGTQ